MNTQNQRLCRLSMQTEGGSWCWALLSGSWGYSTTERGWVLWCVGYLYVSFACFGVNEAIADRLRGQIAAQIDAYIVWRYGGVKYGGWKGRWIMHSFGGIVVGHLAWNQWFYWRCASIIDSINDSDISHLSGIQDGVLGDPGLEKIMWSIVDIHGWIRYLGIDVMISEGWPFVVFAFFLQDLRNSESWFVAHNESIFNFRKVIIDIWAFGVVFVPHVIPLPLDTRGRAQPR